MRTRRLGRLLYPVWLLAVVLAVAWVVHARWVARVRPKTFAPDVVVPGIDAALRAQLGPLRDPAERPDAFAHFPREKPAGTTRIGAFGDSFTWGTEVTAGNDYPALLAARAREDGHAGVEVLGFGNPGFGLHQSYLLWERVGRHYALDQVVVLGLAGLWASRDTSFTFWDPPAAKLGFHARFVLDGDGVRLVPVLGATEAERFAAYVRFVPHARYARYDRKPPAFLRAWLPGDRTVRNPLYYRRGSVVEEAYATYRVLLAQMAERAGRVLVADLDGELGALAAGLDAPGLRIVRVPPVSSFPYLAAQRHLGPWGNQLVADTVAAALGLGGPPRHLVLEPLGAAAVAEGPPRTLAEAGAIAVTLDDVPAGGLYAYRRDDAFAADRLDRLDEGVTGLAMVPLSGATLTDALLLPVRGDGPPAVELDDGAHRLAVPPQPIGAPGLGLWRLDLCASAELRAALGVADHAPCTTIEHAAAARPHGRALAIRVGGAPLLTAVAADDGRTLLLDPNERFYRLRADGDARPHPDGLADTGRVWLVLDAAPGAPGGARRVPLARWRVETVPIPPAS